MTGRTLSGRYKLVEIIGRGGMAEVWRARDERLNRDVAIKQLRVNLATDSNFQARFNREAQSAAGLNHPNIVGVYDTGTERDEHGIMVPYIVMELVQGRTLREILRSGQRIPDATAFQYTTGVLDALAYSHKAGIVHRDIKPANVMLTTAGQIKVMDFGIARAVSDTSATMTQTAAIIGTAQYLSPEQARGETVDARSDLYSTGCLLYELLTGKPPFQGDSPVSVAYQHVREAVTPPSQLNPNVTPQMDAVVLKALAKDPDQRYQSAEEMRADCARLLSGEQVTAVIPPAVVTPAGDDMATQVFTPNDTVSETAIQTGPARALDPTTQDAIEEYEEPKKKRSWLTFVLVGLLLVLLGIVGFFFLQMNGSDDKKDVVSVPSVLTSMEEAAKNTLTEANLVPKVKYSDGDAETKGQVIAQDPVGGTEVRIGSTVTITVNSGPKTLAVPEGLIGMSETEARAALAEAGFTNVIKQDAPANKEGPDTAEDTVVDVQPASGKKIQSDTQITIYVATGKSTLPRVIGMTADEAKAELAKSGFTNVEVWETETSVEAENGKVTLQNPTGNTTQLRSTSITLTVARYKAPAPAATTTAPGGERTNAADPGRNPEGEN